MMEKQFVSIKIIICKIIEKRAKYARFDILKQLAVENFDLKY